MSKPTKRLGRGLSSLIQATKPSADNSVSEAISVSDEQRLAMRHVEPRKPEADEDAVADGRSVERGIDVVDVPTSDNTSPDNSGTVVMPTGRDSDDSVSGVGVSDASAPETEARGPVSQPARVITVVAESTATGRELDSELRRTHGPASDSGGNGGYGEVLDRGVGGNRAENLSGSEVAGVSASPRVACEVRVDAIAPGRHQPRQQFDRESIASLAASIARNGLIQPLVVRPLRAGDGESQGSVQYELIAGERRWRASRAAGIESVSVIVREVDDERSLELALVENLQREDLNAIDRAEAYARYCNEFGLRPEEVARRLNEDRTTVVNYLRLLELPAEVKELVAAGRLSMGHARSILGVERTENRVQLAQAVVANGLSVRALEEIVRRKRRSRGADPADAPRIGAVTAGAQAHVVDLENRFQQALGTKVKIRPGRGKGRGRIVIEYYSLDDFDRIATKVGVDLG